MRAAGSSIGATTRQCVVEHDATVRAKVPLLAKVMPFVGHAPTRARGTIGGSLANADPAAEIALVAVTLGGDAGLSRRRNGCRDCRRRLLHRADDDGAAGGRLPHGGALSGLARGAHRRRLPRGQCPPQRLRLRVGGGAGRARRRTPLPACRARHRRRHALPAAARRGGRRAHRHAGRGSDRPRRRATRRSPISSCCPTCMRRPTIAGARRRALPCARSPMPIVPREGAHAR